MSKPTATNLKEGSVIWDDDLKCDSWWVLRKGKWVQETDPVGAVSIRPGRYALGPHTWVRSEDGTWSLYDARGVRLRGALTVSPKATKAPPAVSDDSSESPLE